LSETLLLLLGPRQLLEDLFSLRQKLVTLTGHFFVLLLEVLEGVFDLLVGLLGCFSLSIGTLLFGLKLLNHCLVGLKLGLVLGLQLRVLLHQGVELLLRIDMPLVDFLEETLSFRKIYLIILELLDNELLLVNLLRKLGF